MIRIISCVAFALAVVAGPVAAKKDKETEKVVLADTPDRFASSATAVRDQMEPGKRFEFLSDIDRESVNRSLDLMAAMIEENGTVSAMSDSEQVRLFNEQEKVNGLLVQNAADRLICKYERPIGSQIPRKSCVTLRELKLGQRHGQKAMGQLEKHWRARRADELQKFNGGAPGAM